jgi:hypothetical protein
MGGPHSIVDRTFYNGYLGILNQVYFLITKFVLKTSLYNENSDLFSNY